ncbi:MAG: hypothetical protein IPN97_13130 [Saprospiraceae bacterium]|nr:hypothetical protein [Saprospiraceae bacterium]
MMKLIFFQTFVFVLTFMGTGNTQPFQPKYTVTASMDTTMKKVTGKCIIHLQTQLSEVTFHAWANAFRAKTTPFAESFLKHKNNIFYFYDNKTELGGYEVLKVKSNEQVITVDPSQEIIKIPLPANGKDEHIIEIEFTLLLPKYTEGLGWNKNYIRLSSWYPTLAYHDGKKWHETPYLPDLVLPEAMGEHIINLSVPENYRLLYEKNSIKNDSSSALKMVTEGKSPVIVVVLKDKISTYEYNGNKKITWTVFKDRNQSNQTEKIDNAIFFFNKHFGYSGTTHFFYTSFIKKKKHNDLAFIKFQVLPFLYHHYNVSENQHFFLKALHRYIFVNYVESQGKKLIKPEVLIKQFVGNTKNDEADKYFDWNGRTDYYFSHRYDLDFPDCCFHTISNNAIKHLESYLGKEELFSIITNYLKDHFHDEISFEGLFHYASQKSGKDVLPILLSYTFKDKRVDYYFKNYSVNDDSIFVEIENRTGNVVPFPLQLETKVGSKEIWNDGFSGTQKLSFPKQYDYEIIKNVTIDRNLIVREVSRKDNRLKIHGSKNSADIRNIHFFSKTIQSHAVFGYSYSDKLLLGYSIDSYRYAKLKGWYYHMMPMYSFSANKILGEASLGYNLIPSSGPQNIRFEVSIKSFDRFYQKILDYRERYIKVQPAVIINFSEPILPTKSQLILRSVLLWEEKGQFTNEGKYTGKSYEPSAIFRSDYVFKKANNLGDREVRAGLEFQSYTPVFAEKKSHYLKTNFAASREFYYNPDKMVTARMYASAFLWNTEKSSNSFDPVFTRGSMSLLHQGFNDYLYDEYYTIRQNQREGLGNQVSFREGGGFKHAFGVGQNIGMSNRFAASVNLVADVPFDDILKVFFDAGVYGNTAGKSSILYSGGIALFLDKDKYFRLFYPLMMSKDLNNLHGSKFFTWSKLSFSVDVNTIMEK